MPNDTRGILPAASGSALGLLQHTAPGTAGEETDAAALEIASYHTPTAEQSARHLAIAAALSNFLVAIVQFAPAGPERSTAISRAREAKYWASAAVALEGH